MEQQNSFLLFFLMNDMFYDYLFVGILLIIFF